MLGSWQEKSSGPKDLTDNVLSSIRLTCMTNGVKTVLLRRNGLVP
jgi:hypothetical protein